MSLFFLGAHTHIVLYVMRHSENDYCNFTSRSSQSMTFPHFSNTLYLSVHSFTALPLNSILSILYFQAEYWIWTGDIGPHDHFSTREEVITHIRVVGQLVKKYSKVPVIPCIGNHEGKCTLTLIKNCCITVNNRISVY